VRETAPTELTRSKASVPRDIAVVEHSSARTGTVRRRPQFVMVLMTAVTVLTRKIANYLARALSSNAVQTDDAYWIRGSATVNRIVKTVATKTRRCAVSAFESQCNHTDFYNLFSTSDTRFLCFEALDS